MHLAYSHHGPHSHNQQEPRVERGRDRCPPFRRRSSDHPPGKIRASMPAVRGPSRRHTIITVTLSTGFLRIYTIHKAILSLSSSRMPTTTFMLGTLFLRSVYASRMMKWSSSVTRRASMSQTSGLYATLELVRKRRGGKPMVI